MRQKDNMKTSSTVPGIIVMSVFTTNLVSSEPGARRVAMARCHGDELGVEVDAIERADAARRRVREEDAV